MVVRTRVKAKSTETKYPETHPNPLRIDPDAYRRNSDLTMKEIMGQWKKAKLIYRMGKQLEPHPSNFKIIMLLSAGNEKLALANATVMTDHTWKRVYRYFKPFLNGRTQADWMKARINHDRKIENRDTIRRFLCEFQEDARLYPMSREKYNEFSRNLWEKRNCPHFNCRIVNGVRWGNAETVTTKTYRPAILRRILGTVIKGTRIDFVLAA